MYNNDQQSPMLFFVLNTFVIVNNVLLHLDSFNKI